MIQKLMLFFWRLSEKHWILRPFELIGDFLEEWGLDHGYVRFNQEIMEAIEAARKEHHANH
jgi:hypothetical protein